ncbi:SgcJ/EcaC family oxidoreductase [Chlorogloeopsis sp. ULAP02]|uniref:SgcJ/EcaC family oxidoreductase n=1 Tax=Chlorogloeopsis sp. ULAP02 TaxID=3107926 RepID=UPI0031375239
MSLQTSPILTSNPTDETAIRAVVQQMVDAWRRSDGTAYAAVFTEDADYIAFNGTHFKGRQEIASSHQQLFDTFLRGTDLKGEIKSMRFLSSEIALVHANYRIVDSWRTEVSSMRESIETFVAVKRDNGWILTAFHITRVQHRNWLQWVLCVIASGGCGGGSSEAAAIPARTIALRFSR